jgi:uncharacterized protein YcnI
VRRVIGLAFALVLVTATPAFAHVSVNPSTAAEGSFSKLTFRVPNESDTASTTSVQVVMPDGLEGVRTRALPGWTIDVERSGDTVTSVTWSGGEIAPGEFEEFDISVGPIPEADSLVFRAVQTYSDGEVVRWIDPVVEGEEEPEHPAPTLTITEGTGDHHGGAAADDGEESGDASDDEDDDGADPLAFVALIVAGPAAVAAVAALVYARKRAPQ